MARRSVLAVHHALGDGDVRSKEVVEEGAEGRTTARREGGERVGRGLQRPRVNGKGAGPPPARRGALL